MHRNKFCIFILIACLTKGALSHTIKNSPHCYSDNKNPYPYTGKTTLYSHVYDVKEIEWKESEWELPNCKSQQIWLLCRSGTSDVNLHQYSKIFNLTHIRDSIVSNHETNGSGRLCEKDLLELKDWEPDSDSSDKDLVSQGENELKMLGDRLTRGGHDFRSTYATRTVDSMKAFIEGVFGNETELFWSEVVPTIHDTLLKPYKVCKPWKNVTKNNQTNEFINGSEMMKVVADVSRRLGFANDIKKEEIFSIYDACRYEWAWYPDELSSWCVAFTDDDLRVLEYRNDLYNYYHAGPGNEINSQLGCHPLQDMFNHFTKLEKARDDREPKGVFYFAHSEILMMFLTAMGIGNDTAPLTAQNYRDMQHRKWRSSLLTPFAANFAAVFYSCNDSKTPFKVAFYLSENPLTLEGCENGVCDWEWVKKKLGDIATNCNMEVCEKE